MLVVKVFYKYFKLDEFIKNSVSPVIQKLNIKIIFSIFKKKKIQQFKFIFYDSSKFKFLR